MINHMHKSGNCVERAGGADCVCMHKYHAFTCCYVGMALRYGYSYTWIVCMCEWL